MFTSTNPSPQPSPRLAGRGSYFRSVRVSRCTQLNQAGSVMSIPSCRETESRCFTEGYNSHARSPVGRWGIVGWFVADSSVREAYLRLANWWLPE